MLSLFHVFRAFSIFFYILDTALLVYVVLSWFRPRFRFYYLLENFISPFVRPFRRLNLWLMSRFRLPFDFSCWMAMIAISIIERLMWRLYYLLSMIP